MDVAPDDDPSIADAILSAQALGIATAREAADMSLGPITDQSWARMRNRWERHWALPLETLVALREKHVFKQSD